MKLVGLKIKKLYGNYNYNVEFNPDVTFIYGANGCGKTTILNITEAIITGQLFKLFSYAFDSVELLYRKKSEDHAQSIEITRSQNQLHVTFQGKTYFIDKIDMLDGRSMSEREKREQLRKYYSDYPILGTIRHTFNYVYLPLNRTHTGYEIEERGAYSYRRYIDNRIYDESLTISPNAQDLAMREVETLIQFQVSQINIKLNEISDGFRNEILQTTLSIHTDLSIESILMSAVSNRNTVQELYETKKAYFRILDELHIKSEADVKNEQFFDEVIEEYKQLQRKGFKDLGIEFLFKYSEIEKVKKVVRIAEKMEKKKSEIRKPIETFLETMNSFIQNNEDEKQIQLDPLGQVYFVTKNNKRRISVHYLSSGEKQLLMFFANLIFKVKQTSSGIFVVDEPELSLHLSWQRIFVQKTLDINKNIQLIFATHAPEMIGSHRSKMYKLVKEYTE